MEVYQVLNSDVKIGDTLVIQDSDIGITDLKLIRTEADKEKIPNNSECLVLKELKIQAKDVKKGEIIVLMNRPCKIVDISHSK
jgi:hypothetical protein